MNSARDGIAPPGKSRLALSRRLRCQRWQPMGCWVTWPSLSKPYESRLHGRSIRRSWVSTRKSAGGFAKIFCTNSAPHTVWGSSSHRGHNCLPKLAAGLTVANSQVVRPFSGRMIETTLTYSGDPARWAISPRTRKAPDRPLAAPSGRPGRLARGPGPGRPRQGRHGRRSTRSSRNSGVDRPRPDRPHVPHADDRAGAPRQAVSASGTSRASTRCCA